MKLALSLGKKTRKPSERFESIEGRVRVSICQMGRYPGLKKRSVIPGLPAKVITLEDTTVEETVEVILDAIREQKPSKRKRKE